MTEHETITWELAACVHHEGDLAFIRNLDFPHPMVCFDRRQLARLDFWPPVGDVFSLTYEVEWDHGTNWVRPISVRVDQSSHED